MLRCMVHKAIVAPVHKSMGPAFGGCCAVSLRSVPGAFWVYLRTGRRTMTAQFGLTTPFTGECVCVCVRVRVRVCVIES